MLRISVRKREIYRHLGRDRTQPRDCRARLVEQPHMGIASRKITIRVWESRLILYRDPQSRDCLVETSAEKQRGTDQRRRHFRCARAEAEGDLSMPDREMRFAGPQSQLLMCQPRA